MLLRITGLCFLCSMSLGCAATRDSAGSLGVNAPTTVEAATDGENDQDSPLDSGTTDTFSEVMTTVDSPEKPPSAKQKRIVWNTNKQRSAPKQVTTDHAAVEADSSTASEHVKPAPPPPLEIENAAQSAPPVEVETITPDEPEIDRLQEQTVAYIRALYSKAAYADMPLPELLSIASVSIAAPDRPFDAGAFPDLTERERELLGSFHSFFVELGRSLRETQDAEAMVASLEALQASLNQQPQLLIPQVTLCRKVVGYGNFEEFEKNVFLAGSEQLAIVYTEVDDFSSELNEAGEWVTDLSQELVIYSDSANFPVWKQEWRSAPYKSRNEINDFFITQIITIPKNLTVGGYTLKIRIRDEQTDMVAENTVAFRIVADERMAAKK